MNKNIIYGIKNSVNGKIYIGLTSNGLRKRSNEHTKLLDKGKHPNKHLQSAWNKYGRSAFEIYIIEEVSEPESLPDREIFYILKYQSYLDDYGYNLSMGGERDVPSPRSILNKIAGSHKVPVAEYDLDGNFIAKYASVKEAARKLGLRDTDIHRSCKKEYKLRDRLFKKGNDLPLKIAPYKNEAAESKYKPVVQYDLAGNFIKIWPSVTSAAQATGLDRTAISQARIKLGTCGGFIWRSPDEKIITRPSRHHRKKVYIYDLNLNLVGEKESLGACARSLKIRIQALGKHVWKKKPYKNHYYLYECPPNINN